MATVRDTEQTLAFFEGREVLDPNDISFADWVAILDSTVKVLTPKHIHGFRDAQDIVAKPMPGENSKLPYRYTTPPARIWLGRPGGSWEFEWHFQYLVCGERFYAEQVNGTHLLTQEYLLFSKTSEFYALTTTWELRNGWYHFSNNTNDGHLRVRSCAYEGVVKWCLEVTQRGPYLLREVLQSLCNAVEETEKDLVGKLERATRQRQALSQRLSSISLVEPGDKVWVVCHSHAWDRDLNNEYFPIERKVQKVKNGMVHFKDGSQRKLWDCYATKEECQAACPVPHRDE